MFYFTLNFWKINHLKQKHPIYLILPLMQNVTAIQNHVLFILKKGLSPSLTYHNYDHTLNVMEQCMAIAKAEGITDEDTLTELHIASLYHDAGFLYVYEGHEEKSCEMVREQLPGFGISNTSIENICEIIMGTKMPQSPKNHLQQIICDADLDYLGRDDFFIISDSLCKEVLTYKIVSNKIEWEKRQELFLQSHNYFTKSSQKLRTPVQLQHIKKLLEDKRKEGAKI